MVVDNVLNDSKLIFDKSAIDVDTDEKLVPNDVDDEIVICIIEKLDPTVVDNVESEFLKVDAS